MVCIILIKTTLNSLIISAYVQHFRTVYYNPFSRVKLRAPERGPFAPAAASPKPFQQ